MAARTATQGLDIPSRFPTGLIAVLALSLLLAGVAFGIGSSRSNTKT